MNKHLLLHVKHTVQHDSLTYNEPGEFIQVNAAIVETTNITMI